MEALTVNKLLLACKQAIKDGYGDHKILVSDDDECNGYHELFYVFSDTQDIKDNMESWCNMLPYGVDENNIDEYVTLG